VAEEFLDGAQVGAVAEQVGGEGVAEAVGVEGGIGGEQAGVQFDDGAGAAIAEARAAGRAGRTAKYLSKAAAALPPNGTWRSLRPLPRTRSQRSAASISARFSPVSSLTRSPQP
jgi:hypothetical protein